MNKDILKLDYFTLFEIPVGYPINRAEIQEKMHQLQQQYHPDNHAADAENNAFAIAASSQINHAYNTLNDPLERAIYLLKHLGVEVDLVHDTKFSHDFLFKQIELREAIGDAEANEDIDALETIEQDLKQEFNQLEKQITDKFASQEYADIIELIKQLSFYNKLLKLVNDTLCSL
ncbi:MAG: Fe-S protein assembly co-chaperone HscB [Neisseriaceae bacterium]|nr:MAG: Fe-S protein assembly co-chaperone HscB [Neisseriaceae bacterium]